MNKFFKRPSTIGSTKRKLAGSSAIALQLLLAAYPFNSGAQEARDPERQEIDRNSFLPLGVYWPGEYSFNREPEEVRWQKIDKVLDGLSEQNVNTIWITHLSTEVAAKLAKHAAKRNIALVASNLELAFENPKNREGDYLNLPKETLEKWGDAPAPLAWGLGDEPAPAYTDKMAEYVSAWKVQKHPVTTVIMPVYVETEVPKLVGLNYLSVDIYPFFSDKNPNGPGTHPASVAYFIRESKKAQRVAAQMNAEFWAMPQIFQEPWGPREQDEEGNIVHLPGGGPHWRMPSPGEVRWQGWAAIACGSRAVIYFSLFFNIGLKPVDQPLPPELTYAVKERTNSGSPGGILYMDGRATPQYLAMGGLFKEIQPLAPIVTKMKPTEPLATFENRRNPGDIVETFETADRKKYLIVVNGNVKEEAELVLNVSKDLAEVRDLKADAKVRLHYKGAEKQVRVKLEAGGGTMLQLSLRE